MSTFKFEATPLPAHTPANADGPRKKRKRAPAPGAADDCFTCSNRNIKCDRRRPYCSQCLDGGQDCAGYKTQLTWGVGVASRGKLRGLSLPVAGMTKASIEANNASKPKRKVTSGKAGPAAATVTTSSTAPGSSNAHSSQHDSTLLKTTTSQAPLPAVSSRRESHPSRPLAAREGPPQRTPQDGHIHINPPAFNFYGTVHEVSPAPTVYSQNGSLSPSHEKGPPHLQQSSYPTPSPTSHFFPLSQPPYPNTSVPIHQPYQVGSQQPILYHAGYNLSQVLYTPQHEFASPTNLASAAPPPPSMTDLMVPSSLPNLVDEDDIEEINRNFDNEGYHSDALITSTPSIPSDLGIAFPLTGVGAVGKTPRMQYLIQYYAEVIAPVCVAFDGPSNPLRNQILSLAARSESLQHAIAALSASNIRQRQESGTLSTGKTPGARRSSYMHLNLTAEAWDDSIKLTVQDRKREESLHKYAAVRSLNQQLASPILRKDDSALATLLMLCLFHVCDSGIARFQTQFAGVKKLLTLRGQSRDGTNDDTRWMTRIFTFFDSVAATVNDREGQIGGHYVDLSAHVEGEWPYETLSGIDSRLTKSIARLGRLNVLSQGKPVEATPTIVSRPIPSTPSYMHNQHHDDFGKFDGNGWMRILSDEDLFNLKTMSPTAHEQFWREWREVRHELLSWSFDNTRFDGSDPSQPYLAPDQRFDMRNISESFRYSSLLYTERLADPSLPSLDPKIQDWVQKSLHHIKQVRADVYLLWPLFITGAECGDEHERNVIRERCLDIQKDSGFMNNSTCLTLLEKVWQGDHGRGCSGPPSTKPDNAPPTSSTFRFRDVMLAEGNEGEWIVV